MIDNFWTKWIIATTLTIVGACVVGAVTHSWIAGIIGYFIFGILKDSYLLAAHIKKVDNNSEIR